MHKNFTWAYAFFLSSSWALGAQAEERTEIIAASSLSSYCVPQTSVRGDLDRLVVDHNLVIRPQHVAEEGDIFVGARITSRPGELWLLGAEGWRRIAHDDDLLNAEYAHFEKLNLVTPVSPFYQPSDLRAVAGVGEIWIGYGLRGGESTSKASFDNMVANKRYNLIWQTPTSIEDSISKGIVQLPSELCFSTSEVLRVSQQPSLDVTFGDD